MNVGPLEPGDMNMQIEARPRPIKDAAETMRAWVGLAAAFITAAGSGGILLSSDQVTALQGVLAALLPIVSAVSVALTAFGIRKRSEPLVTPMTDPRDNDGTPLVAMGGRTPSGGVLR